MAQRYAISDLAETRAYFAHPLLGARLLECARTLNALQERSALQIFGATNALKFRSSMTLFEAAVGPGSEFSRVLEHYFAAERDAATLARLAGAA